MRFPRVLLSVGALWLALTLSRADIVINEVHYDPEPKTDLAEFIELLNAGPAPVDVSGFYFSDGFEFTFPENTVIEPDAYLVLAQNVDGYNRRYGSIFAGGAKAFGQFASGRLSNEGERIVLRDALGEVVDEVNYQANFPWPTAPQGALVDGRGVSMELLHPGLDNNLGGSWRAALRPTPGKANSILTDLSEIPPIIRQVEHHPKAPKSGDTVAVSAKVTDEDGVASVLMHYQLLEPGNYIRLSDDSYETTWESLEMKDDGMGADAVAGDSVFSVTVPETLQRHRNLVRYRITMEDMAGNALQAPYSDDPQPNFAYFVYDGVPPWKGSIQPGVEPQITFSAETMNSIAVYHLLAQRADVEGQQWGADRDYLGTIVYEDEVYDHIRFSKRGRASLGQVGKEKWDWNFNRGHRFQAKDNYGEPYAVKWREINVLPGTNPWWGNDISTDGTILNEAVGFRIFQLIGSPASNTHFFQLRVIDDVSEAPADQYFGDLWGLYIAIQDPDSRFLEERGMEDGNIYNWHGTGVQKNQGATSVTGGSDFTEFVTHLSNSTPLEWWQAHLNFDAYFSFNCGNLIVNNSDMRPGENMMTYHHPNGQTYPLPWDLDLTFERAPHLGRGDTPAWENLHRVLAHESVDAGYQSRAREIQDLLLSEDQVSMLIDEYSRFVWVNAAQEITIPVVSLTRSGGTATVVTAEPHGFETDDVVLVVGVETNFYDGEKVIKKVSETEFTYAVSIFAGNPQGSNITVSKASSEKPLVLMDQAMWDYHPRKRKKGIYYKNITGIESEDFRGYQAYMKDFLGPGGYGYELLGSHIDAADGPNTPSITYTGPAGYASVTDLTFESSAFSGGSLFAPQAFAAMQWRLAEITDRSRDDFDPTLPRRYEIDADWLSEQVTIFEPAVRIPANVPRPGGAYRVRARMKNESGHWSHWSPPVEFVAAAPEIGPYTSGLVLSEIMYNPAPPTAEETARGWSSTSFEFVELTNIRDEILDLTHVRFTKGIDFDFVGSAITSLAPGGFVLVVDDLEAFESRYGPGLPVAGVFQDGQLANGGERIKLSFGAGTPIRDFSYGDGDGWPQEADGGGKSLVLTALTADADLSDPSSWSASGRTGGSPGALEEPSGEQTYDSWLAVHFSEAERDDEALVAWEADPDADGWNNFIEFALAGDPRAGDVLAPALRLDVMGRSVLSHRIPSDPVAVLYTIESSSDLEMWTDASAEFGPPADSSVGGRYAREYLGTAPAQAAKYYRLRITTR
ncbi:MAG TPA: lamin tail domain-containing protein [Verrucomicrobiales bacterium]|nr:lamin tail domain-containing protein [Verrucomicrobiales bacterium]